MSMMEKAACLNLSLSKLGVRRKAATEKAAGFDASEQIAAGAVISGADASSVSASKRLLDCPELKAVGTLDSEIKGYLADRCLPSPFRGGIWLIPLVMVDDVNASLQRFAIQRADLVDAFMAVYSAAIDAARERLGPLFNPGDYASPADARQAFAIEWQFVSMDTPETLRDVSPELFERERQRAEAMWRDAADEIRQALRASLAELVTHTAERLRPRLDGTRPVLRDSVLSNLSQFLEFFEARNLTDDADLSALVGQARDVINGVQTQALRDDPTLRDSIGAAVAALVPTAEDLVNLPKRRIALPTPAAATEGAPADAGTGAAA